MFLIELTNENDWSQKLLLRGDLIEKIVPARGNTSEILLTTGRWTSVLEGPSEVWRKVQEAQEAQEAK